MRGLELYRALFVNREDAYAVQRVDGGYLCRKREVAESVLTAHLGGGITCGWYCLNRANEIKWACVDADSEDGQRLLQQVSGKLREFGMPSYMEASREGRGHLWVFLEPIAARPVREMLKRMVEEGMEVFPKQNRISSRGYGCLVRGPLGVHRRTGKRYGFLDPETLDRVGRNLADQLDYLKGASRVEERTIAEALAELPASEPERSEARAERLEVDLVAVAGLFTELSDRGHYYTGLCPLHPESHHSFAVYPNPGGVGRWMCFHAYRGGDAVSLYAEVKGISYQDALGELGKMGMIELRAYWGQKVR